MSIKIIKLVNGETLIGEVQPMPEGYTDLKIIDPLQLDFNEEEYQYSLIAFLWIPLTSEKTCVELKRDHIVAEIDSQQSLGKYYRRSLAFLTGDMDEIQHLLAEESAMKEESEMKREPLDKEGKVVPLRSMRISANTVH